MGRYYNKGVLQTHSQVFTPNIWGGSTKTFTVPQGVSGQILLTAVAPGGCALGSAALPATLTTGGAVFARINGIDPPWLVSCNSAVTYFGLEFMGRYCVGSTSDSINPGLHGPNNTVSGNYVNAAGYFNPHDSIPWGVVMSNMSGAGTQVISSTTDGFNFIHTSVTVSVGGAFIGCVFGADGCAIAGWTGGIVYTSNRGQTWTNITAATGLIVAGKFNYLNGTWISTAGPTTSNPQFCYVTNPLNADGTPATWTVSSAQPLGVCDIGWTGSTWVLATTDTTNCLISNTLAGVFTLHPHGGNATYLVRNCYSSPTGEVVLYASGNGYPTAANNIRATTGTATVFNNVDVSTYFPTAQTYLTVRWVPFASGGMWLVGDNNTSVYASTASVITPVFTSAAVYGGAIEQQSANGNTLNTGIIQHIGGDYATFGNATIVKYKSAGQVTAFVNGTTLGADWGYQDTTSHSPPLTVKKNGVLVLSLDGGGTGTPTKGGDGGGRIFFGNTGPGVGPTGVGMSGANITTLIGNGGAKLVANTNISAGGGTYAAYDIRYAPLPGARVPGASGGYVGAASYIGGGGGSLMSPAGVADIPVGYSIPPSAFYISSKIGSYGAGASGMAYNSTSFVSAGGGGEGVYKYPLQVQGGDILTFEMPPGSLYINVVATTTCYPGPAGESYVLIEYDA